MYCSYLEGTAGTAFTEPGNAVQIVGGDGLILLLDEAECWEVEAGLLAIPILQHGGQLIYGAPFNKRRTSQVPHLHITRIHTSSVLMIERRGDEFKTRAPFWFTGSCFLVIAWDRGKHAGMCEGLYLKLDCWTETQNSLEKTHKLQKVGSTLFFFPFSAKCFRVFL